VLADILNAGNDPANDVDVDPRTHLKRDAKLEADRGEPMPPLDPRD
jgi:hypothetical protein